MGKRAGPGGRDGEALSRSGPCENGGSECKAKFFCKPSAKAGGAKKAPDTGPSAAAVAAASLALQALAPRSERLRRETSEGKTCVESPQMLGAFAARSCWSPAPAARLLLLRLSVRGLREPQLRAAAAARSRCGGYWG